MAYDQFIFRVHAIQRMFERKIREVDVREVLQSGDVIERYPDDVPYPSYLVLGFRGTRPIHVVAADDAEHGQTIIISLYEPDPARWDASFKQRK